MYTADYSVRKYLMNKLINYVNLQYPSKAAADQVKLYIGDSTVSRNQVSRANTVQNGQVIPPTVRNLCDLRIEFVAVGQNFKSASEQIESLLEALFSPGFFDELNSTLAMAIFSISIDESLMTTQAESSETLYVHTQTITLKYGE